MQKHFEMLGFKARDVVTGFEGIVDSICFDLYGCVQVSLRPEIDKKKPSEIPDGRWFDIKRMKPISKTPVMARPNFALPEIGAADKRMPTSSLPSR